MISSSSLVCFIIMCSLNKSALVYYRWFDTIIEAISEEKRMKGSSRKKKEILINNINPEWKDLYEETRFW